jgi:mannose/fructose/N-acetylgalactosamine-specific phosphotransferase system component IIC
MGECGELYVCRENKDIYILVSCEANEAYLIYLFYNFYLPTCTAVEMPSFVIFGIENLFALYYSFQWWKNNKERKRKKKKEGKKKEEKKSSKERRREGK